MLAGDSFTLAGMPFGPHQLRVAAQRDSMPAQAVF